MQEVQDDNQDLQESIIEILENWNGGSESEIYATIESVYKDKLAQFSKKKFKNTLNLLLKKRILYKRGELYFLNNSSE